MFRNLPNAMVIAAVVFTAIAFSQGEAKGQFNCADPACLELQVHYQGASVTTAPVGATLVARPAYQFKVGTYTNVRLTFETPDHFLGATMETPDGWLRTCEALPVNPPVPPADIWRIRCTWEWVGNDGVLIVTSEPGAPSMYTGVIQANVISQRYSTPAEFGIFAGGAYTAPFTARLEYTIGGVDYASQSATTTVTMLHELWIRHWPRPDRLAIDNRGVIGVFGDAGGIVGRHFYRGFAIRNQENLTNSNAGRYATRTLTGSNIQVELPAFVRYQGFQAWSGELNWVQGANHTAVVGQLGGVVHLVFMNTSPGWNLGRSPRMTAWNQTETSFNTLIDTSYVRINWSVDCEEQVEGSGLALPFTDFTTGPASGTTPLVVSAVTTDLPSGQSVTASTDMAKTTWLTDGSGSLTNGARSCSPAFGAGGTWKEVHGWSGAQPAAKYPRTGDVQRWNVNMTPPSGVPSLGRTTVLDKIPPFQHYSGTISTPTGWTTWACRFENPNDSWWSLNFEMRPTAAPANCLTVFPGTSPRTYPYYCLDRHWYFDTNNLALDPDTFDPTDPDSVWYWDSLARTGCRPTTDVCPYVNNNGVRVPPTTCALSLRADEVTHIAWHRDSWEHPTIVGADPVVFNANFTTVVGDLSDLPGGAESITVQNRMLIGGGEFENLYCPDVPVLDLAWLLRTCRDANGLAVTCPNICQRPCADGEVPDSSNPPHCYVAQPGDVPDHAWRGALYYVTNEISALAEIRGNMTTVSRNLPPEDTAIVTCGWSVRSDAATLANPRFTITLPTAFQPRDIAYDVGTTYENQPWPLAPGSDPAPELRYVPVSGNNPSIASLIAAGIMLDVDKYLIDRDNNGTLESVRYEITFVPDNIEANFALKVGAFRWWETNSVLYSRGYFQIAVEPSADYPYVGGQLYPANCEITDAARPRDTVWSDPDLAFYPSTATFNMNVSMGAEIRMTAEPTCRTNSARPSYRVALESSGVALEQAEGIFIVPVDEGIFFEGAERLPNPAITSNPALELTTTANLDAALLADPGTVTWVALATYSGDPALVTGVRLRFRPSTTSPQVDNRLPAYTTAEFRVDLQKPNLSLADIGFQFTTRGWTRAQGTTAIPYARSDLFETNTIGQCPIGVRVTKTFDDNGNGTPDAGETRLDGWTFNLQVEPGQSLTTAPLLNPDGTPTTSPHADQVGVTGIPTTGSGSFVFNVWPGQVYSVDEEIPAAATAWGPFWARAGRMSPEPDIGLDGYLVEFDEQVHAFGNTCSCGDDYTCGAADRCVAPGVCEFGTATGTGYSTTPTGCEPFRFYALVEDNAGVFVGSIVCFLDDSETPPLVSCDADAQGFLTVDQTRNACE